MCRMVDTRTTLRFVILTGWRERAKGLLGTQANAPAVALAGCASVHTWGMTYPLDVALVTRGGEVLVSRRAVPPSRLVSAPGAFFALERPASDDPWPTQGSWVGLAESSRADAYDGKGELAYV